jgi:hypothetical protein
MGAALALTLGASGPARAWPSGTFKVTNDAQRIVECTLLVDGRTRTYLKVHPTKTYADTFSVGRLLQLVCMRGSEDSFGPLKLGIDYRFVEAPSDRVKLVAVAEH